MPDIEYVSGLNLMISRELAQRRMCVSVPSLGCKSLYWRNHISHFCMTHSTLSEYPEFNKPSIYIELNWIIQLRCHFLGKTSLSLSCRTDHSPCYTQNLLWLWGGLFSVKSFYLHIKVDIWPDLSNYSSLPRTHRFSD